MTGPRILQADIELWLTGYIRRELADVDLLAKYPVLDGFEVDNREPTVGTEDFPAKLVVVRHDGTTSGDIHLGSTAVGVTVLMGGVESIAEASLAARVIHAIVRDSARVEAGNPVAAVISSLGPYAVPESQPRARLYSTHELATVGSTL